MMISCGGETPQNNGALFVAPSASVIGKVRLEKDSSVWYGAVLRGDIEPIIVGSGSNVQDGAVLHCSKHCPLTIGRNVTIGHAAVVHGCTVEDDVLVGMHATLLNRCVIGKGSIVAAGAVVPEGMIVPPGSIVMGVPAYVRGPLNERQRSLAPDGAEEYRELARLHASTNREVPCEK